MKKSIFLLCFIISSIYAQSQSFAWAKTFYGMASDGQFITADDSGNTYTTGKFYGTVDFDPGPGTYTLTTTSSTNYDAYITKLDANGNFLWAKNIGGVGFDAGTSVALDAAGNVYVTGYFSQTVDFDPGPATYTLNSTGVFISKLDASGNFVWAKSLSNGQGTSICIDASGNVNTAGYFRGTLDFDPGPGTYTIASNGTSYNDIFVWKLDANGNFLWARTMGGTDNDVAYGIATDAANNIYTTGSFEGTVDFDPGPATYTFTAYSINADMFISKLDASGNFVWAKRIGDASGNAIAVDAYANVYTTGLFRNSSDFDPGTGTAILSVGNNTNLSSAFISKLDASGNYIMANNFTNTNQAYSYGYGIALDPYGSVYTTGVIVGALDFDPGPGTSSGSGSSNGTAYVNKLCAFPALTITGTSSICAGQSATLTASGAAAYSWSTGAATSSVIVSPTGLTVYTVTGTHGGGCALSKTISVSVNNLPNVTISGTPTLCAGQSRILTAGGASTYTWSTGVNTTTIVVSPASATIYTVTGTNSLGCVNTKTVNITVNALPVISISGNTLVCQGKNTALTGSGITSYTWNTGAQTASINPIITASTSFTLNGKDASGCAGLPAVLIVSVNLSPVITVSNGTVCSGQSFTLNPTGASSYTYSGGSPVVNPSSTSNYTISGLGSNGCTGTVVATVSVNALPNVSVSSNTAVLCSGSTATLSANGATTYAWSTGETTASILVSPTATSVYTVTGTNANGCKKASVITQSVSVCQVGIEQLFPDEIALQIYPNPAQNRLVISYVLEKESTVHISLADAVGKEVKHIYTGMQGQAGTYAHTEAVSDLNNGLYLVKIRIDRRVYTIKLVKMDE